MGVFDKMLENMKDKKFMEEVAMRLEASLVEVEKIQNGELPAKSAREFLDEIRSKGE